MFPYSENYHSFRLVSIDPGLNNIGIADFSIDTQPFAITRIHAETLKEQRVVDDVYYDEELAEERHYKRERMINALMKHIREANPSIVVCESPFFDRTKPSSFAVLVEVLLDIQQAIRRYDDRIRFCVFAPQLVKKTLDVAGIKGKEIVKEAMGKQTHLLNVLVDDFEGLDEHSIDAMAVGYTYITRNYQKKELT